MNILFQSARPNIVAFFSFDEAPLFGPEDCETIASTSHLAAIEEMLDASLLPETQDVEAWLTTNTEFWTIVAYKPDTVSDADREQWSEWHAEHIREAFSEEYGNEEGEGHLSNEDEQELKRRTTELVDWYVSRAKVWRCEAVRTFTFDSLDVLSMVQQLRPDWMKKKDAPGV